MRRRAGKYVLEQIKLMKKKKRTQRRKEPAKFFSLRSFAALRFCVKAFAFSAKRPRVKDYVEGELNHNTPLPSSGREFSGTL